jgi:hypothetical protein
MAAKTATVGDYEVEVTPINSAVVEFRVWWVQWREDGRPMYRQQGWRVSSDITAERTIAEVMLHGKLKWDGCCDYRRTGGYTHVCGFDELEQQLKVWRTIYRLGSELMDEVDYLEQL